MTDTFSEFRRRIESVVRAGRATDLQKEVLNLHEGYVRERFVLQQEDAAYLLALASTLALR